MHFISFLCLIALARTFSTMFNRSDKSRHPCLFLVLGNCIQSFTIKYGVMWVGWEGILDSICQKMPSVLICPVFDISWKGVGVLSSIFSASVDNDLVYFCILLIHLFSINWFLDIKPTCIPEIDPIQPYGIILFICCQLLFASTINPQV